MNWFLVTMEGQVPPELEERLLLAYEHAMRNRPPGVVQSMLTRDVHDPTTWRIHTIWESHASLEAHFQSGDPMPSAYAFQLLEITAEAVGSEVVAADASMTVALQQQNDQDDTLS